MFEVRFNSINFTQDTLSFVKNHCNVLFVINIPSRNKLSQQRCQEVSPIESTSHDRWCNQAFFTKRVLITPAWIRAVFIIIDNFYSSNHPPTKIEFIIGIGCELYDIDASAMEIDICDGVGCNHDVIGQITTGMDVCGIHNGMTAIVDIWIKISLFILFVYILTILYNMIDLKLENLSEFECEEGNSNNINTIVTNMYKINIAVPVAIVGFLLFVINLIIHAIDELSLHIEISIKSVVIIVAIVLLVSNLAVQSSIDAVYCNTQVIHGVCGLFYSLFLFFEVVACFF